MMDRNGTVNFLCGLGAGLALGILYAPQRGEDLRRMVATKTKQGAEGIKGQASELWDTASDLVGKGRAELTRKQGDVKQAVQAGKMAYNETVG